MATGIYVPQRLKPRSFCGGRGTVPTAVRDANGALKPCPDVQPSLHTDSKAWGDQESQQRCRHSGAGTACRAPTEQSRQSGLASAFGRRSKLRRGLHSKGVTAQQSGGKPPHSKGWRSRWGSFVWCRGNSSPILSSGGARQAAPLLVVSGVDEAKADPFPQDHAGRKRRAHRPQTARPGSG